ncbi:MAG: hypothetical protein K6F52_05135 [Clostridia bacterium]|nr:hypothetical protein [Clostridia bacterium]
MEKIKTAFKEHTKEKITALAFLVVIFAMLLGMVTTTHDLGEGFLLTYRTNVPTGAPVIQRLEGAIDAAENAVNEGAFLRQNYVETYGLAQVLMNKHVVTDYNYGALYKTALSGQTTFSVQEELYVPDLAQSVYGLVNTLLQKKIDFLYIQLPFKVAPAKYGGNKELPIYVHDYSNENADTFVKSMTDANVAAYDLRDDFWSSGYSQKELFFNTDHHWSIKGAFLATGLIAKYLNENYDFGIPKDLYTEDNFEKTVYKDWFIGTMGRRVGRVYGGLDDFTLYTPKFDTDIELTQVEGSYVQKFTGDFEKAVLEMKYLENPDLTTNRYAVYHGDYQELRYVNKLAENDKKVLILKDSFGIPVYSLLSLGVREVRAIDLRLFTQDVAEYAASYDPDLVILMYNADLHAGDLFDFNPGAGLNPDVPIN